MRPNRQELEGRVVVGPSITPIDTFSAPSQRPVVRVQQADLSGLVGLSRTLQEAKTAEAKVIASEEADIAAEIARRELAGETFGQIVKDLLGTEGTPNQTKAKLVRMQRDGKISPTESPVFLGLYENAKIGLLTQRASEALNRRADDLVKEGRSVIRTTADHPDADLFLRNRITRATATIIDEELAGYFDGLSDLSMGKLEAALESLTGDLETKAYVMLQNELEDELINTKTMSAAATMQEVVDNLNGDGPYSFSENAHDALATELQKIARVYADSGKADWHTAFIDGPVRSMVERLKMVADPDEQLEALEGLEDMLHEVRAPGGDQPFGGMTKRSSQISSMIAVAKRGAKSRARADREITGAQEVSEYLKPFFDLTMTPATDMTEDQQGRIRALIEAAPAHIQSAVRGEIENRQRSAALFGGQGQQTEDQELLATQVQGRIDVFGRDRARYHEMYERDPSALQQYLVKTEGLTPLAAAKIVNNVGAQQSTQEQAEAQWPLTVNQLFRAGREGRPVMVQDDGSLDLREILGEGRQVEDQRFWNGLRGEMAELVSQYGEQIGTGAMSPASAAIALNAEINRRVDAYLEQVEIDNKMLTGAEEVDLARILAGRRVESRSQIVFGEDTEAPDEPIEQIGYDLQTALRKNFTLPLFQKPVEGYSVDRARRLIAQVGILGAENVKEKFEGDALLAVEKSGVSFEEQEQQAAKFGASLAFDIIKRAPFGTHSVDGSVPPGFEETFRAEMNEALGLLGENFTEGDRNLPFDNLYQRMSDSSELLYFDGEKLIVDYSRMPLVSLYTPVKNLGPAAGDPQKMQQVLSDMGAIRPENSIDDFRILRAEANRRLPDLNIGVQTSLEQYQERPLDYEQFIAHANGGNQLFAYAKTTADNLFRIKRGRYFNPKSKIHRETYGVIVAHVFDQLRLMEQAIR